MTVKSAPFYWLECDAPDCPQRCPGDDDDVVAYDTEKTAIMMAGESDWLLIGGKHLCADHAFAERGE